MDIIQLNGVENITDFLENVKTALTKKIGLEFYEYQKSKIIFAICVHEIECWLLPFQNVSEAAKKKITGCLGTLERIANKVGYSLNQKNYRDGKYYHDLSKPMADYNTLERTASKNPSLKIFLIQLDEIINKNQSSE